MKILNLYAGIGGNRKLWGDDHEVTAVEINSEIAKIYSDFFPNDEIIVGDAHQFLLKNFQEFDFIWASPPCPTHSRINTLLVNGRGLQPKFPDMKLYEEIIFLKHYFKGKWVIENVRSFYTPLITPIEIGRHYYWANFPINITENATQKIDNRKGKASLDIKQKAIGIEIKNFHNFKGDKRQLINNCVEPETARKILKCALGSQSTIANIPEVKDED